jgi:putative inorganic carbon (HCO3(-)) transporter
VTASYITPNADLANRDWLVVLAAGVGVVLAASLFYTPLPLITILGVPFCFYFLTRPYELLLAMVFLIPFNFVFTVGQIPVAAELLKVFAWIPFLATRSERGHLVGSRYNKWFAVWAGIMVLSIFRSNDLPYSVKECVRLGSNIGLCYLAVNLVDSKEKVMQIFKVLTVSTLLVACYGFYQWAIQDYGPLFWLVNPRIDTNLSHGRFTFWEWRGRIISVLTSEMELGHYFNLCLPLAVVLWITEGRRRISSKWFLMIATILAGLLLTFTFGAWLSLVATAGVFFLLLDKKRRWKVVLTALLTIAIFAGLLLGPLRPFVEVKLLGNGIGSLAWDAFTRLDAWIFALQTWQTHPFIGVGIGNYEILEYAHEFIHSPWGPSGSTPHETYLYLLAESGVIGLVSMLFVVLGNVRSNLQLRSHPQFGLIALALAFALCTNLIGWFGDDSTFFGPHTSYLVWLLLGLGEVIRKLSRKHSPLPQLLGAPNAG